MFFWLLVVFSFFTKMYAFRSLCSAENEQFKSPVDKQTTIMLLWSFTQWMNCFLPHFRIKRKLLCRLLKKPLKFNIRKCSKVSNTIVWKIIDRKLVWRHFVGQSGAIPITFAANLIFHVSHRIIVLFHVMRHFQ